MKNLAFSLSLITLSLLAIACKKNDVDYREQYIGTYTVSATGTVLVSEKVTSTKVSTYDLKVEKSNNPDELIFTDFLGTYSVKETDNKFVINPFTTPFTNNGNTYALNASGNGVFNNNQINVSITASNYINGVSSRLELSGFGVKK